MKIVQINTVCNGSTGRIMLNLYQIQKENGYDPYVIYGRRKAPEGIRSYKMSSFLDFGMHVMRNFLFGESGFGSKRRTEKLIQYLKNVQPDLIHLHNLHGFYLHIGVLFDYIKSKNIPVVWTLHDCWSFTGQCANFDMVGCEKWKRVCYDCPQYRSAYPYSIFKDNSKNNYNHKKEIFSYVDKLELVVPSNWLAGMVRQSFLKDYKICIIPNGIDMEAFHPVNNVPDRLNKCRIPKLNEKIIILGVANVWTESKGFSFFTRLADRLEDQYLILLIGVNPYQKRRIRKKYKGRVEGLDRTESTLELAQFYSLADVFVNPTLDDNFPTTNLEALACGTPVVTFRTGGSGECIHSGNGVVVEKGNIQQLLDAVCYVTEKGKDAFDCRASALKYQKENQNKKYIDLYGTLLDERDNSMK